VGTIDQVGSLAEILGCGVATLQVKYLGLPFGASYKSIQLSIEGILFMVVCFRSERVQNCSMD
jgi:hypothetical protein